MLTREIIARVREIQLRTGRQVADVLAGEYVSVFKGTGVEFDEVRPYVPGDDVRSIDWNVTARMGEAFVKRYVEERQLTIVLKSDVRGTMEAIRDLVENKSGEKLKVEVVHAGVGAINESDVTLAIASSAIVIGFHVRPEPAARKLAEREGIDVRLYDVVYDLVDDVTGIMLGLLPPKLTEKVEGHAEVRQLFQIPRVGTIAGCFVPDGLIKRSNAVRVVRDGVVAYSGKLASLRRVKDDVREVQSGLECGIRVENYNDVKVGDILESYIVEETADTL